jgi:hypothetical protein
MSGQLRHKYPVYVAMESLHSHVGLRTDYFVNAAMVQLEIPHVNVISKMDMVRKKRSFMEKFYQPDGEELAAELNRESNPNLAR